MNQLPQRLLTSVVLVAAVLGVLLWAPLWIFAVILNGFMLVALYEFFTMVRHRGILVHRPLGLALGLVFCWLVTWRSLVKPGHMIAPMLNESATLFNWAWDMFWPATIVIIFLRQFTRRNTFETLNSLATTLFGLAYIPGLLSYLFYLRAFKSQDGGWLVLFLVLVTKMGDAGAYVLGNVMGRHVLLARVSPRKTVEGLLGGVLVSAATAAVANSMVARLGGSMIAGAVLGLVLGICGQVGDLAESLLKRDCQVKDSGRLLPGLGGILDVLDSVLFTGPVFYAFLIYG